MKKSKMEIIYAQQPIPKTITKSIFLAGPTPRDKETKGWRSEALAYLKKIKYDGTVFVPEFKDGMQDEKVGFEYKEQIEWEASCMNIADTILFWIPRELKKMPGFTTNDEYGYWKTSGKIVLSFPKTADKIRYQEYYAKKLNIPTFHSLEESLDFVVKQLGEGALRKGGEIHVPLYVWQHVAFQRWMKDLKIAGNRIDDAKVEYVKKVGKNNEILFFICLWAKVWITKEKRHKENEVVFMRTSISSCVLYKLDRENLMNSDIVLVKEFRTPVSNAEGMVNEVPGGSSFKNTESAIQVIVDELHEEAGIEIEPDKLTFEGERQLQATTLSHKCFLFSYELNDKELKTIQAKKGKIFGNIEDTEMTYVETMKLDELLKNTNVDWANIGFILSVLTKKMNEAKTVAENFVIKGFIRKTLEENF